jgi:hypothetical protein
MWGYHYQFQCLSNVHIHVLDQQCEGTIDQEIVHLRELPSLFRRFGMEPNVHHCGVLQTDRDGNMVER